MIRVLFLCLIVAFVPSVVHAKKVPDCGAVSKVKIWDTFQSLKKLEEIRDHYGDIRRDLKRSCKKMENLERWEKSTAASAVINDEDYQKKKKRLVADVTDTMRGIKGQLDIMVYEYRLFRKSTMAGSPTKATYMNSTQVRTELIKVATAHDKIVGFQGKLKALGKEVNALMKAKPAK